jgi:hypothetical protein
MTSTTSLTRRAYDLPFAGASVQAIAAELNLVTHPAEPAQKASPVKAETAQKVLSTPTKASICLRNSPFFLTKIDTE